MTTTKPLLSTVREAAQILRIKRSKVYILISMGTLKATKIGADWRIRTDSIEALVGEIPADIYTSFPKHGLMKKQLAESGLTEQAKPAALAA